MRIQFYDKEKLIKTWHNVNPALNFIPQNGDDVLLHFGDGAYGYQEGSPVGIPGRVPDGLEDT